MEIRISKESEVPLRQQLAEQIVLLIAIEKLKPGETMPSVRELARRLKIHHNTVSHAYADLVRRSWLERKRGSKLVVRAQRPRFLGARQAKPPDLDGLINQTIAAARERGVSLQQLRDRVRERIMAEPPDHLLVVEQEAGLGRLLQEELREALKVPAEACSRDQLGSNRGLTVGALIVTPQYGLSDVEPLAPGDRPPVPLAFCGADEHVERVRRLKEPSVIAVVSVSEAFRKTAESLLAAAAGRRHTIMELAWPLDSPGALRGADVVFCDSIAFRELDSPKSFLYRLVSRASLDDLASTWKALRQV